jgi:flagellar hook assembly protein FlgD
VHRFRLLPTALVLALLAGSAVAFAVSEGLKLQKRPITPTFITKVFSPVCNCPQAKALIKLRLLRRDTITVTVVDSNGKEVRRLVDRKRFNVGLHHFTWDGRDAAGKVLDSGSYRPKVTFADIHRTFVLPNPIRVDVTRPTVKVVSVQPRAFSPDGDSRADQVTVRYRVSEQAHALLLANGHQRVRTFLYPLHGSLDWNGAAGGGKLPPGTYTLSVVAVDLAGNRSLPAPAGKVRLRYVALPGGPVTAAAGTTVRVPVDTDATIVRWTVRKGSSVVGRGRGGMTVVVRAPKKPGRYVLVLDAAGHRLNTDLIVRK